MTALYSRLARAFGWGSAGQCPAPHVAKTPASHGAVCSLGAGAQKALTDLADGRANSSSRGADQLVAPDVVLLLTRIADSLDRIEQGGWRISVTPPAPSPKRPETDPCRGPVASELQLTPAVAEWFRQQGIAGPAARLPDESTPASGEFE